MNNYSCPSSGKNPVDVEVNGSISLLGEEGEGFHQEVGP